jgi:hypothetical protein
MPRNRIPTPDTLPAAAGVAATTLARPPATVRKSRHSLRSFLGASDIVSPLHPPDSCCPLCSVQQSKLAYNALDSSSSTVSPPSLATDGPPLRAAIVAAPGHRPLLLEPDPLGSATANHAASFRLSLTRAGHLRASDAGCYALCTQRLRSVTYFPACSSTRPPSLPLDTRQQPLPSPGQDSSQSPLYKLGTQNKQRNTVAGKDGAQRTDAGTDTCSPLTVGRPASIVLEFPFVALHVWMDARCLHGKSGRVAEVNKHKDDINDDVDMDEDEDEDDGDDDDDDKNTERSPVIRQQHANETTDPGRRSENFLGARSPVANRAANLRRQTMQMQELSKSLEALVGSPGPDSLSCGADPAHLSCFEQRLSTERSLLPDAIDQRRVSTALCRFAWRLAVWDMPDVYPYLVEDSNQRDEDSLADAFVAEEASLEHLMRLPLVPACGQRSAVYLHAKGPDAPWSVVQCTEVESMPASSPVEALAVREMVQQKSINIPMSEILDFSATLTWSNVVSFFNGLLMSFLRFG